MESPDAGAEGAATVDEADAEDDEAGVAAAAAWLDDLVPRSLAQLNLRPQLPFLDFVPVVAGAAAAVDVAADPFVLCLLLLLPFAWLAHGELRQHLQVRDFLPADVSELSSVAAVDIG